MGKIKKKGTSGNAKNYITRSQAVRKLQIPLPDFRRLCIFKGIYPREPRSKKRASKSSTPSTTFYYTKDIQYLLHEPLLEKFRDQKALAKKISKALGRNEVSDAARLERNLTPRIRLDHIIKERYPTFVDALRDMDDALSMLFLFANLPSTENVPPKAVAKCQRLTLEFEHYLIRTHSLRKSFLSIKGIYYQATIQGQDVLWLVPYRFVQRAGTDIDFRIMATFVEFYTTLLSFVNFRLYTSIGLVYPPKLDAKSEESGAELSAFQLENQGNAGQAEVAEALDTEMHSKAQAEADRLLSLPEAEAGTAETGDVQAEALTAGDEPTAVDEPASTTLDQFTSLDPNADTLLQPSLTADVYTASQLFESFTVFLSRETPRHPLEFILRAFGCKRVGWDTSLGEPGAYCSEDDMRITHQIVDRPDIPLPSPPLTDGGLDTDDEDGPAVARKTNERIPGRIYVQPQWVWDSVNAGQLQRADLYAPGATLPPHLSPWVKPKKGGYDPTVPLAEQETAAEAEADSEEDELEADEALEEASDGEEIEGVRGDEEARELEDEVIVDDGMDVELAASDDDEEDDILDTKAGAGIDEWGGFSGDEAGDVDESTREARAHQAELEAEALGHMPQSGKNDAKKQAREAAQSKRTKAEREALEDVERRKLMMPRRKRKMFEKMVYSNAKKDEEAERLRAKKRKIEKQGGKPKAG
ncbi:mRNA-binding ribosome synthesis protein nop7 [Friedmanniomyces endolithicus]|uniref:Pescadillo homolog n=1 Tax=Friedmanniomyces endolithicus TaxID=329885 RepID=A0AAN6L2M4_9PEZI|nr:mRNA-binding ribosome synthesis protein nop7 [Friedmanniomyces endolithicus]KAK1011463.1 mRNA-binding ribosome synthesis protein nop7 [Friedmanniomyces endolithicus]KAK1014177.1 mRNA-binding ribosome synthesis protein nop7 [Friedmanniomyces endolithicus]KAK1025614.1 mRNA-binding ribosome synthesis protein nop7 [Friedmanniomyces endolithicus]